QFELNKVQKLIASYEALFETEKQNNGSSSCWTTYGYAESRVCLYYSISPKESSFIYNIGYMNDLLGRSPVTSASYLHWMLSGKIHLERRRRLRRFMRIWSKNAALAPVFRLVSMSHWRQSSDWCLSFASL
ncbi:MAG: hypothetical protein H7259_08780, partial [Cytophagales bacterium]|nr:hypothetical protein [Cytophaga sp.]